MTLISPIPNGPFYSAPSNYINSPQGFLVVGSGLSVASDGTLLVTSATGGTVSQVTAGVGLSGGNITSTGIINLVPATNVSLGGVKIGANLAVSPDGTISALPPGIGTITGVFGSSGITGGGTSGSVTLSLQAASTTQFGGVQVGAGINSTGGLISLVPASTTAVGGVQLATASEVIAGANPAKAVTPATLAAKAASTLAPGIVQLSDNASLTSSVLAATPTAVKTAYDAAVAAQATASAALPKAGGTMTGVITFAPAQTFPGVAFPVATTNSLGVVSVGSGLSVNSSGVLSTSNVGTVTAVTCGPGLGSPASGNTISTSGTIRLLAPSTDGLSLGGVKKGAGIDIAFDGTISVTPGSFLLTNNQYSYNGYIWPIPNATPALPCPGAVGQVLTIANNVTGQLAWTSSGTLSSVIAGSGLTVISTPTTATVSLATVPSITPGNIGGQALIPTLAVNAQGQITSMGEANPFTPFQTPTVTAPFILTMDFAGNNTNWAWTTNGNTTIQNPLNAVSGQTGALLITQSPLLSYSLAWGNSWKFQGFSPFGGAGLAEVTMLQFTVVASNYIVVTAVGPSIG
jgi:hypothetical protein